MPTWAEGEKVRISFVSGNEVLKALYSVRIAAILGLTPVSTENASLISSKFRMPTLVTSWVVRFVGGGSTVSSSSFGGGGRKVFIELPAASAGLPSPDCFQALNRRDSEIGR